ncbi:MAG: GTP-binding protein [Alphaproteobacteria bacterium]|nr:GTP-binding protein [Alphaproteobacteria bacterium]
MSEAMDLLRRQLGDDALLVSTQRLGASGGFKITGAIDDDDSVERDLAAIYNDEAPVNEFVQKIRRVLQDHGTPELLLNRILERVQIPQNQSRELVCLANALDTELKFHNLPEHIKGQAFIVCGPAGSGKTTLVAKLATRAHLSGKHVGLISADTVRAGALEQLVAFTNILNINLTKARSPENLFQQVKLLSQTCDSIYIDMPACNPFVPSDMSFVSEYISASTALPMLVLPAGIDPIESSEIAESFAQSGALFLFATRLDAARRFGGILSAADSGKLSMCEASMSPVVTKGLSPINAISLSKLFLSAIAQSAPNF